MKWFLRTTAQGEILQGVVGVGLIGSALAQELARNARPLPELDCQFDWSSPARLQDGLRQASALLDRHLPALSPTHLRLFWSAGRAGFAASQAQTDAELAGFKTVLAWSAALGIGTSPEFHLISSAGGLHEGQLLASDPQAVSRERPYAQLKLAQERVLFDAWRGTARVYRPSSVFGVPRPGQRLGLLPTLVRNALLHRPSTVSGSISTQRDFIAADDVAAFVARQRPLANGIDYLVSARARSIFSVVRLLEAQLQRNIAVTFSIRPDNFQSTTFSRVLLPSGFTPSGLEVWVTRIVTAVLGLGQRAA